MASRVSRLTRPSYVQHTADRGDQEIRLCQDMRRFFEASYACVVTELALLAEFRAIDIFAGRFLFLKLVSFRHAVSPSSTPPVIQRTSLQCLHAKDDFEISKQMAYLTLIPTPIWNISTISRRTLGRNWHCTVLLRDIETES